MEKLTVYIVLFAFLLLHFDRSLAGLLAQPVQPLKPGDYSAPNTVPAFPVQTETPTCQLDLSADFGGVNAACGRNSDRAGAAPSWRRGCGQPTPARRCKSLKGEGKNVSEEEDGDNRASKMLNRDCQLMGLTWLLARNKTAYIPTVSAVLRAIMYSAHPPQESKCSPDQENMPLAVDSSVVPILRFVLVIVVDGQSLVSNFAPNHYYCVSGMVVCVNTQTQFGCFLAFSLVGLLASFDNPCFFCYVLSGLGSREAS
ncbi:putative GPI-anchored protein [Camellia lanceoleosa]|uniref:GPI-anchored protein n=1 Tax=Camellia lanceoleosa TaxID=1840588 RepID=A0ACC0HBG6_9ERIC|nr:putative GPI-anchored protein [Camellia lanceoleosa]